MAAPDVLLKRLALGMAAKVIAQGQGIQERLGAPSAEGCQIATENVGGNGEFVAAGCQGAAALKCTARRLLKRRSGGVGGAGRSAAAHALMQPAS